MLGFLQACSLSWGLIFVCACIGKRVDVYWCVYVQTVGLGLLGWASLFLCGLVTMLAGREGWNLSRVTVINSPFNNSCPTWPATHSLCPLCIYFYVYLCIYSKKKITTVGLQYVFFGVGVRWFHRFGILDGVVSQTNQMVGLFRSQMTLSICLVALRRSAFCHICSKYCAGLCVPIWRMVIFFVI